MDERSCLRLLPLDDRPAPAGDDDAPAVSPVVLSFDVEEHHRIEAAYGTECPPAWQFQYARRMRDTTLMLLDMLARHDTLATFYIVGDIARSQPRLVRAIADAGHEVGSHGWDHRRVGRFDRHSFREDIRSSCDALAQVAGRRISGYRAPCFSVTADTSWAVEVLQSCGLRYDSSVFPVRHDRYGVPDAPRTPFRLRAGGAEMLELPPATWRLFGGNLPVGGGGYFRLFPSWVLEAGLRQLRGVGPESAGMLYFHPWEFDPGQRKLPLSRVARWRTYVGVGSAARRLERLLGRHTFCRAIDVVEQLARANARLPVYDLGGVPAAQTVRAA